MWENVAYRAENYPFSYHIALRHPLLGIGARAPREKYLEDYSIHYPYITKGNFAFSVGNIRTSENIFLTFLADFGFPFFLLYSGSVVLLFIRLVRHTLQGDKANVIQPICILLPLTAGLLHLMILDGLYLPQVSWFFHILLGLIPARAPSG